MLRRVSHEAAVDISGIGIGCTGPVDPSTGIIGQVSFLPGWEGANVVEGLSQEFGVPTALENDADATALAEASWGWGRGKTQFICVTVGTGIGGGVMLDGRLYRGVDGSHPEIGHHVLDPSGPRCFCGAYGCWESLASGPAMVNWLRANTPSRSARAANMTAAEICRLAERGDYLARQAVIREAYYLGLGLANLITLFTPDAIALGGGLMESAHLFLDDARRVIARNCGLVPFGKTQIGVASLGPDTGLIGAARVWYHRFG
jgi:glucokinase